MSRAADLLAACEAGDEVRIEQLGWRSVMDALRAWTKRLDGEQLAPYALILGDEDPDAIVEAIKSLVPECRFRPGAAEIMAAMRGGRLHVPHPTDYPTRPGERVLPRLDRTERAYEEVLGMLLAGALVCPCVPRSPQLNMNARGVLTCPNCGGLEPGQVDQARGIFTEPDDLPNPSPEDFIRWAKEVQQERIMEGRRRSPLLDALAADGHLATLYGRMVKPMPKISEADRAREREILGWPEP